jgi:hypothetical protein
MLYLSLHSPSDRRRPGEPSLARLATATFGGQMVQKPWGDRGPGLLFDLAGLAGWFGGDAGERPLFDNHFELKIF